jgi:hypothetical protein
MKFYLVTLIVCLYTIQNTLYASVLNAGSVNTSSQGMVDTLKNNRLRLVVLETRSNKTIKTIYKRQVLVEKEFMILMNLTRIILFRLPLIRIGPLKLNKGAYAHSLDMARTKKFAHYNWKARSSQYNFRGENIIYNHRGALIKYIGWMTSTGHRENILDWSYLFTGVGFCKKVEITTRYKSGHKIESKKIISTYGTQVFR